jgi:hypothetical protein
LNHGFRGGKGITLALTTKEISSTSKEMRDEKRPFYTAVKGIHKQE